MIATLITTHVTDALNRLLQQYKDKPQLAAFITSLTTEIQNLENAIYSLNEGRSVYGSIGVQLDNLGTLVGISRQGLSDDEYLLFILGKIGENFSDTTIERVSQIYGTLTQSNLVHELDLPPAACSLMSAAYYVNPAVVNTIATLLNGALGAGIYLDSLGIFDPDEPFAFLGGLSTDKGFDDLLDPGVGGKFAGLLTIGLPFEFGTTVIDYDKQRGFGDTTSPTQGGLFRSL